MVSLMMQTSARFFPIATILFIDCQAASIDLAAHPALYHPEANMLLHASLPSLVGSVRHHRGRLECVFLFYGTHSAQGHPVAIVLLHCVLSKFVWKRAVAPWPIEMCVAV